MKAGTRENNYNYILQTHTNTYTTISFYKIRLGGQAQWLTPVIPALWEAKAGGSRGQEFETSLTNMHFGRPSWVDHLRSEVQDQSDQRGKTPSLLKIEKLARHGTVTHTCNPSTFEVEVGKSLRGQEFKTSLTNIMKLPQFLQNGISNRQQVKIKIQFPNKVIYPKGYNKLDHLKSGVRHQWSQHNEIPSLLKILKISRAWWFAPVIPATWEAEAGEPPELRRQGRQGAKIMPLHTSLGDRHFGSLRQADHLRSVVQDQPGQHGKTQFLLKIQKLVGHGGTRLGGYISRMVEKEQSPVCDISLQSNLRAVHKVKGLKKLGIPVPL
ncbi:NANOG neighbor homeobox [Plecturocebus cupreus]